MKSLRHPFVLIPLMLGVAFGSFGQTTDLNFFVPEIVVAQEGNELLNPFLGGLEAPQFQSFQLNDDGIPDLLVFDRVGNQLLPFIAQHEEGVLNFRFAPSYQSLFPPLQYLFLLSDLNCDGLEDIITSRTLTSAADVKLVAYLQSQDGEGLPNFSPKDFRLPGHPDSLIRIHAFDIPAVDDVNGDGLADLLYIPISGTTIQYFERVDTSAQSCDSLFFTFADACWGDVSYGLNTDFDLGGCTSGFAPVTGCAGSAMRLEDFDMDGDMDLYFSGRYDRHIQALVNGGSLDSATLVSQQEDWIRDGEELPDFPATYSIATNEDDVEVLLIASNLISGLGVAPTTSEILQFERNTGDTLWELIKQQFLRETTIDHGFRSSPTVWDVDQDGLLDLVIGYNRAHPQYAYVSGLAWYRNTGTAQSPSFVLQDENFGRLYNQLQKALAPSFGDLDGDGQAELVTGLANGELITWRAIDSLTGEYELYFPNPLEGLEVDAFAKPQLVDANLDGLVDVVCASRSGRISLWHNSGSAHSPAFTLTTDTLGQFVPSGYQQETSAFLLPQEEGFQLFIGQRDGELAAYSGSIWDNPLTLVHDFQGIDVGERASMCLADLNSDGLQDFVVGNMRGGITIYFTENPVSTGNQTAVPQEGWRVYPNPASHSMVYFECEQASTGGQLLLLDALGRSVTSWTITPNTTHASLPLPTGLTPGIYFLLLTTPTVQSTQRLLIRQL